MEWLSTLSFGNISTWTEYFHMPLPMLVSQHMLMRIFWFLEKSHAHSQRVKDSATRQPRLRLCMSVTKKNVIAGRRGMGNPRFAKCTIRNVCTEPSPSRMGKILRKAYLNDSEQKITKFNNRNSNENQALITESGTMRLGTWEGQSFAVPMPHTSVRSVTGSCFLLSLPSSVWIICSNSIRATIKQMLKKCRMTFKWHLSINQPKPQTSEEDFHLIQFTVISLFS